MTRDEVVLLLTYAQITTGIAVTAHIVDTWHGKRTIQNLDLATAKAAVDVFDEGSDNEYFSLRQLNRCVKVVKDRRRAAEAKARAQQFALTARPAMPEESWRERRERLTGIPANPPPRVTEKCATAALPVIHTGPMPVVQPDAVRRDMSTFLDGFGRIA